MKSLFEHNGGTFRTAGDYRIPNLTVPDAPEYHIGIWGRMRLDYLKKHRRLLYVNLLTSGNLTEHLSEIDAAATERRETTIQQMAAVQGVTENLKATDQKAWVGAMNNIRACAEEIVLSELIYS